MEFERQYKLAKVTIGYHDNSLDYLIIEKDNHVLEHTYQDDVILEVLLDGHNKIIDHNVITEDVLGTRYNNGLIESQDGTSPVAFRDDIQIERVGPNSRNVYYRGVFMGTMTNFNPVIRNELFTLTEDRNGITVESNIRDADNILFLLGFAKTSTFPINMIQNLPGLGFREFIMTMSDLYREGVFLSYMEKLFGSVLREVRWDSSEDELAPSHTLRIKAGLNSCYMRMDTNDTDFKCSIVDSAGVIYDYNITSTDPKHQDFHYWVMFKLPRMFG